MAKKGRQSKSAQRILKGLERGRRALELRKTGMNFRLIGEDIGITTAGARAACMREIGHIREDLAESALELVEIQLLQLRDMMLGVWEKATKGDVKAIIAALSIQNRQAKLLGLDAPKTAEITVVEAPKVQVYLPENHRMNGGGVVIDGELVSAHDN